MQGDTLGSLKHGHGRLTCTNGDVYTGQWRYDKRDGTGHAVFERQKSITGSAQPKPICYEGGWSNDRTHGYSNQLQSVHCKSEACLAFFAYSRGQQCWVLQPVDMCRCPTGTHFRLPVCACNLWILGACLRRINSSLLHTGRVHAPMRMVQSTQESGLRTKDQAGVNMSSLTGTGMRANGKLTPCKAKAGSH